MALSPDYRSYSGAPGSAATQAVVDAGLRAYMLRVYNWMASGLVLTGIVAYLIVNTPLRSAFYYSGVTQTGAVVRDQPTGLAILSIFVPLIFVMVMSFGINKLSRRTAQLLYWLFCAAMGASVANILFLYTGESIVRVFFITAGTFAAVSLYGYTTRRDLSRLGGFLIMGLIGIIIASLVTLFIPGAHPGFQFAISIIGVIVFTGLTAYDTQRIRADYVQYAYASGPEMAAKRSVYDALSLYLNFINLFMFLLQILGTRSR